LGRDYGVVQPGKVATLLLLSTNPLTTTGALDTIDTVIVDDRPPHLRDAQRTTVAVA
jgi:hypothetical protein